MTLLGQMYEACGTGEAEAAQKRFLAAVNEHVGKEFRWVLRPKGYPNGALCWTVADISPVSETAEGARGFRGGAVSVAVRQSAGCSLIFHIAHVRGPLFSWKPVAG